MDNIKKFDSKINEFLDRYYKNKIIKGLIISILLSGVLIFLLATLEFIFWFDSTVRLVFLASLIAGILYIVYSQILIPILGYFRVVKVISNKKISRLLSSNLPELQDYVNNIFELRKSNNSGNNKLIKAAISQKIGAVDKFDFNKVIQYNNIYNLMKFVLLVGVVYILVYTLKPDVIVNGTKRIVNFNTTYTKNLGYNYIIDTSKLYVERGNDLDINFNIIGEEVPSSVSIFIGNNEYLCRKISNTSYTFLIKNVNNKLSFRLGNKASLSDTYYVNVLSLPYLKTFNIEAKYPKYINRDNDYFDNVYDLMIPVGTILKYTFHTSYTEKIRYSSNIKEIEVRSNSAFEIIDTVYNDQSYNIIGINEIDKKSFIDKGTIKIIHDLYPEIEVVELTDSKDKTIKYFKGFISDDYGFNSLFFVVNGKSVSVPFNKNLSNQEFFFTYQFSNNASSNEFSYYFKVLDNDEVYGYKESISETFNFKVPDYKELTDYKNFQDSKIEEKIEKSLLMAQEIKKDIENIRNKLFSEKLSSFEKKELINDLNNKQNSLNDLINDLLKNNLEKNSHLNSFENTDKNIENKQAQLQKLLEDVMDDELLKMLEELEKLANEYNKDEIKKQLEDIDFNYNKMEEQLDRNLELLTKYELENNLERIKDELNKISDDNLNYSDSNLSKSNLDSLINNDIKKVDKLNNDYQKNLDKNSELENPMNLSELKSDFDELEKSLKESANDSKKSKKDRFDKNSKKAKELSDKINSMLNNNRVNENGENAETLRQILENLIYFSFTQEGLIESFNSITQNNPAFIDNTILQQNLNEVYSIIKDSLFALSKRTPNLGKHINDKIYNIEKELNNIDELLLDRKIGTSRIKQRKVLENSNDLILLLSESLKNMQNSPGSGGGSSGKKKNKPKQGEPSLSEMRKSQESIKSQLQNMINQMKGKGGKGKSDQLAKMLAQQEIFQSMMSNFMQNGKVGSEVLKELNDINKMIEQNKRDIINDNISNSTLYRQNKIVTRLLNSEKAEKERELDKKRESKESLNQLVSDPAKVFEEIEKSSNFNDILRKNNIRLKYYYQSKYQDYIKILN